MSAERCLMRIFMFKSQANPSLRAFSSNQDGHALPEKFRPWHAVGVIREDALPPHNLSRDVIEKAIADNGFQLWRMKDGK